MFEINAHKNVSHILKTETMAGPLYLSTPRQNLFQEQIDNIKLYPPWFDSWRLFTRQIVGVLLYLGCLMTFRFLIHYWNRRWRRKKWKKAISYSKLGMERALTWGDISKRSKFPISIMKKWSCCCKCVRWNGKKNSSFGCPQRMLFVKTRQIQHLFEQRHPVPRSNFEVVPCFQKIKETFTADSDNDSVHK